MKSFTFGGKEYGFNRPTPARLAVAEGLANESKLLSEILDLPKIFHEDKEQFTKLSEEWKGFCDVVFKAGYDEALSLEELIYPDEVRQIAEDFFSSASERTMKNLQERAELLAKANTKSR